MQLFKFAWSEAKICPVEANQQKKKLYLKMISDRILSFGDENTPQNFILLLTKSVLVNNKNCMA